MGFVILNQIQNTSLGTLLFFPFHSDVLLVNRDFKMHLIAFTKKAFSPRDVIESSLLEVFKMQLDKVLDDLL